MENQLYDFNEFDFNYPDFDVKKPGNIVTDWFFRRLSIWHKSADSYKDGDGRGLLQRYLHAFDPEVLEILYPNVDNFLDITDAQICDPKFLTHIADSLGKPPDIFGSDEGYRNLLSYVVSIYKIKGTKESYRLFFNILGFDMEIYEVPLVTDNSNYDQGGEYDSEEFGSFYDQNVCQPCSYYDLTLYPKPTFFYEITQELINNIRETISFNEPINAKLRNLTIGLKFDDTINIEVEDTNTSWQIIPGSVYDGDLLYDDSNTYEPD